MTLWGGRFSADMDSAAWKLNASINVDQRLALQDIRGSQAWAEALMDAGVLSPIEFEQIHTGLQAVKSEFEAGAFVLEAVDEDIHTAVERRLFELIGPAAGQLHTGRSRNDQVVTDLRLWLLDELPALHKNLEALQVVLLERSERDRGVLIPGYTHLQRAQPILLSHWWLSHFWPLQRDRQRLDDLRGRVSILPLGSGALAGTSYPIDRQALAARLGFSQPAPNSLDAVSDRDFVAELLFCAGLIGIHLSRLAEVVVLFCSTEFGFFELADAFSTGSSLMPQKANPDVFELARGKSGTLVGFLVGFLTTLKGLPSAYDKDLQEDKTPLFHAFDALQGLLPVLAGALDTLKIDPQRMLQSIHPSLMATDLADYFVEMGLPFRQAHTLVGKAVQLSQAQGKNLDQLSLEDYRSLAADHPSLPIDEALYKSFDPIASISRRSSIGGTSPHSVEDQLQQARGALSLI